MKGGILYDGRREGKAGGRTGCQEGRHRARLSLLGIAKRHLGFVRLYRVFKDLQRRFQNFPWLPTLLFGNPDRQEVLVCSLNCAWSAVLGAAFWIRTTQLPAVCITPRVGWSVLLAA